MTQDEHLSQLRHRSLSKLAGVALRDLDAQIHRRHKDRSPFVLLAGGRHWRRPTMKQHIARGKKHWEHNALTYISGLGWTVVILTLAGVVLF